MTLVEALKKIVESQDLTESEMVSVMNQIMEGEASPALLAAFLTALRMKGESVGEIVGAARVMREKAVAIVARSENIVDTCGTGGDGADTFNISTASAFVVAGAGAIVAKHGNRAVSSRSGSADVLKCLGVEISASTETVEKALQEIGIGFLFAPLMHGAMRHAAPVRKELGIRTLFNILGPLTNPAGARAQVIGVYDKSKLRSMALALSDLGSHRAFVVHGSDGLDEITLTGKTHVCELNAGNVEEYDFDPRELGFEYCNAEEIKGGSPEENAGLIRKILSGSKKGPCRDIVVLNASAALLAVGRAESWKEAIELAQKSIESGSASEKLAALVRVTHTGT
ncbi:MAG: anthranilate phosphoribosyltransferase [Nitrospinae bacterium CG11_big_fil_rev_8_21_14_0_20_45_15]|nr:MAG: anthranilate phosphoribosyltransferase [Nitrospinae bacterium CG11_big_fil_rev_8_21_14_0_20_45_15]